MDAKLLAVCFSLAISFLLVQRIFSLRRQAESERNTIREQEKLINELKASLEDKTLKGILPICASCKKIRDENGDWNEVEWFIRQRSDADFSHALCPECYNQVLTDTPGLPRPPGEPLPSAHGASAPFPGIGVLRGDNES